MIVSVMAILLAGCIYLPATPGGESGQTPVITTFDASPSSISAGDRSQLSWSVTGARSVTIDNGIGSVALRGTRTVVPASTTTYVLTASNPQGTVTASVQVIVGGGSTPAALAPTISSFSATPNFISAGSGSVLSWNISNASSATISPNVGSVNPLSGTQSVYPAGTTSYTLTASNSAGSVSQAVTVSVSGPPPAGGLPVINSFEANPNVIAPGSSTTLTWSVSGAASVTIVSGGGSILVVGSAGSVIATPAGTNTYTLQASNTSGTVSKTITVLVGGGGGGTSHTVTLSPVAVETGAVYKDGTVAPGVKFAGDTSGNVAIRCYFSYDISSLAGKDIDSAKLTFTTNNIVRNPFGNLGVLWIAKVNYGIGPLQAADYSIAGSPFTSVGAPPAEVIVTSSVKSAALAGDPRFQVRLHYASETNNDNLADYINFNSAILTVTYTD